MVDIVKQKLNAWVGNANVKAFSDMFPDGDMQNGEVQVTEEFFLLHLSQKALPTSLSKLQKDALISVARQSPRYAEALFAKGGQGLIVDLFAALSRENSFAKVATIPLTVQVAGGDYISITDWKPDASQPHTSGDVALSNWSNAAKTTVLDAMNTVLTAAKGSMVFAGSSANSQEAALMAAVYALRNKKEKLSPALVDALLTLAAHYKPAAEALFSKPSLAQRFFSFFTREPAGGYNYFVDNLPKAKIEGFFSNRMVEPACRGIALNRVAPTGFFGVSLSPGTPGKQFSRKELTALRQQTHNYVAISAKTLDLAIEVQVQEEVPFTGTPGGAKASAAAASSPAVPGDADGFTMSPTGAASSGAAAGSETPPRPGTPPPSNGADRTNEWLRKEHGGGSAPAARSGGAGRALLGKLDAAATGSASASPTAAAYAATSGSQFGPNGQAAVDRAGEKAKDAKKEQDHVASPSGA